VTLTNADPLVEATLARPVLKWAGGKARLAPVLIDHLPPLEFKAYHEPLFGGGALFFALKNRALLRKAYLSDINMPLIEVYLALRDCLEEVMYHLRPHRYEKDHYYAIRALNPETLSLPERAARIIYLNKTCYNGLYRENRSGQFNVPFGRYKNPTICDEPNLRAVSFELQGVDITCRHFSTALDTAKKGDLVYLDPPYYPLSATAHFTGYSRYGFTEADQIALHDVFVELARRGVSVMLSNSDTPFIRDLYAGYPIHTVMARRAINSKPSKRGKISEVVVCSYA
jgi:DNA adenine methylase